MKLKANEAESQVWVSELKGIKWIGDKTISTLIENGINSIEEFKDKTEKELYEFLTPVQYHQISRHIKENNL